MASKKQTRRALFSSIVSLILCCAMLVGTTFAWFTDTVTSGINTITAGNLDVELYHSDNAIKEEKVDSQTVLFDDIELWEPGAVVYENFKVVNEGNLALKYQLALNFANATKNDKGRTLADVLKVAVVEDGFSGDREEAKSLSYTQDLSTFAISGELLDGKESKESKTYGVVIYWQPGDNDNEYNMNNLHEEVLTIDLGVELFATQVENEDDSFDNTYDKGLEMPEITVETPTADALLAALAAGETAVLTDDTELQLDEDFIIPKGQTAAIDLGGKSLTISGDGSIVAEGNLIIDNGELNATAAPDGLIPAIVVNKGAIVELREDVAINVPQGGLGVLVLGGSLTVDGASIDVEAGGTGISTTGFMGECEADIIIKSGSVNGDGTAINIGNASHLDIEIGASANVGKIIGGYGGTSAVITYYGDTAPDVAENAAENLVIRKAVAEDLFVDAEKKNTYVVESEEGFKNAVDYFPLQSASNNEGNPAVIELTSNLDMSGIEWEPWDVMFMTVNGNGYTISNLSNSLFSYAGAVKINDLTLENVTASGNQAATFAASAEGTTMTNCFLKGNNTVTYVDAGKNENGVGAITGVAVDCNLNVTIDENAVVTINKGNIADTEKTVFEDNLYGYKHTTYATNSGVITNNGTVVVNQGVSTAEELTDAVNNATDGSTIYFLKDIAGDANVNQRENVSIVIDGKGYKYDGTIYVYGNSRNTGAETLDIKNINFITTETVTRDFIHSYGNNTMVDQRYAHNVTIEGCTFTDTYNGTVVPARFRQAYNITMKDCTVKGTFSPMWADGCYGITVDNVTANCTNEGFSFGTTSNVVVKNSKVSVTGKYGYGVRVDASVATTLNVSNSTLKADAPVVIRKASNDYVAVIKDTTLNAIGKEKIIVTGSDYKAGVELTAPTGNVTVIIDGKNADGNYIALNADDVEAVIDNAEPGSTVALMPDTNYETIKLSDLKDVTITAAEGTKAIVTIGADAELQDVTLKNFGFEYTGASADCGVVIDANAQIDNLILDGCDFIGTGAKAGRGISGYNNSATLELKNCTFKDIGYPIYAWGGYEAMVIENCTFENIKSWAIMPQSGFDGDLTVTGCTFKDCLGGGLIKAGTLTAGHTFTFTNNTITGCTVAGDHNWFQFNASAGTKVISGNTKDGVAWTPGEADGLK